MPARAPGQERRCGDRRRPRRVHCARSSGGEGRRWPGSRVADGRAGTRRGQSDGDADPRIVARSVPVFGTEARSLADSVPRASRDGTDHATSEGCGPQHGTDQAIGGGGRPAVEERQERSECERPATISGRGPPQCRATSPRLRNARARPGRYPRWSSTRTRAPGGRDASPGSRDRRPCRQSEPSRRRP